MGRIFNNTNTGAPSGGGRINRLKAGQQNQSQAGQTQNVQPTQAPTKKPGLLQRAADFSQNATYGLITSGVSNVYKVGETVLKFPAALIGQRLTTNPLKGINPISAVRDAARYSTEQFRGGDTIAQQAIAGAGTEMEVARQSLEKAKSDYKQNPTPSNKKKLASATVRNITAQAGGYATGATAEIAGNLGNPATAATGYAYNAIQPASRAIKNISLGESTLSISKDMPKKVKGVLPAVASQADNTPQSPLLTEARKYKSAEEFASDLRNASPDYEAPQIKDIYYHGDAFGKGTNLNVKSGLSLSSDSAFAKQYAYRAGGDTATLRPFKLGDGAKVLDKTSLGRIDGDTMGKVIQEAKKGGYDAVKFETTSVNGLASGEELHIINPKSVTELTKSQLTSIWEEAQKGQQVINSGGKTTAKQNQQLQSVIENLRKGKDAQPIQERGFITTVRQSKNTPQGVKDIIKGSYIPKSNASLTEDARALVGADPVAAEALALNPRNAVDIEVGNQLMAHYSAVGNHRKVAQIGEAMATSGTELGQAIQAFSKYDNTTPQGAIRFAQAAIQKHNALGKSIVKMSDDQIKHIYDAAASVQELPMGRERNIATQQLIDEVNNLIPSTVGDKAITVWKAGLLTSLRTHERNILGNTIMSVSERAKDIPAVGADILMSKKTGVRTVTATNQGTISGAKKGWQAAIDVVRTGYDPEQAINKYDVRHVTWGNNPVEQGLKKYTDVVYRTLGAEDKIFWNSAYARSLYDQAGSEAINAGQRGNKAFIEKLVQAPNEQMLLNATLDANVSTFKDKNILSGVINQAKQAMSKNEWSKVGGEILAPFTGVPSSILGKFVDYSPIGFANGVRHAGKVMSGKVPALQRQAAQEIGRGVIGSALYGLGAYLASKGLLTGQAKDAKEARQWELEGKKANSILIGGKWRSLQSVGPQTLILLAGAKAQETLGNKDGLITYGSQIGKDFLGQSFLAGVQGPLNAITDPQRYGMSYAKSQVSSVVPNIVKDTAKAFDPLQRETNSVTDALKGSIPGTRNTLTPKRDVLGNVMSNDTSGLRAYIDLLGSSKKKSSPIIDELSRLNDVGFNATPSKILPTLSSGSGKRKVKIKLTPAELNTLEGNISSELQTKLNREVQSAHYKNMTDEDKAKKIQDVVDKVRSEYKKKAIRSYNR